MPTAEEILDDLHEILTELHEGNRPSAFNSPVFENPFLTTRSGKVKRVEWIERLPEGGFRFRHDLRKYGSTYEPADETVYIMDMSAIGRQDKAIIASPRVASLIGDYSI